jgi:uncharacterized protein (TIGR02246 family)
MLGRCTLIPAIALVALAGCQATETAEQMEHRMQMESDSARAAITAKNEAFGAAFAAQQADALAAAYTADGVVMPPGMPAVTGRDNIQATFAGMFGGMPEGVTLTLRTTQVTANGPVAVERGVYTMTGPGPDGSPMESTGKYLVEWRKVDGEWFMAADVWNADMPEPDM